MSTPANIDISALQDFNVRQAQDWVLSWTYTNADTTPFDLTGYVFRLVVRDLLGFAWVDQSTTAISSGNLVTITVPKAKAIMPSGAFPYELLATPPSQTARSWGFGRMLVQKSQA
jgi:hypothetical protein